MQADHLVNSARSGGFKTNLKETIAKVVRKAPRIKKKPAKVNARRVAQHAAVENTGVPRV